MFIAPAGFNAFGSPPVGVSSGGSFDVFANSQFQHQPAQQQPTQQQQHFVRFDAFSSNSGQSGGGFNAFTGVQQQQIQPQGFNAFGSQPQQQPQQNVGGHGAFSTSSPLPYGGYNAFGNTQPQQPENKQSSFGDFGNTAPAASTFPAFGSFGSSSGNNRAHTQFLGSYLLRYYHLFLSISCFQQLHTKDFNSLYLRILHMNMICYICFLVNPHRNNIVMLCYT